MLIIYSCFNIYQSWSIRQYTILGSIFCYFCTAMFDPLVLMAKEKWGEIKSILKLGLPRSIVGYTYLLTLERNIELGFDNGDEVFCPFGNILNGIVFIHRRVDLKYTHYELNIQCPQDDTITLEEALRSTKIIDWSQQVTISSTPKHVMDCVKSIIEYQNLNIVQLTPLEIFYLDVDTPLFEVSLPQNLEFGYLTLQNTEKVNAVWPHKYPGSECHFEQLINENLGYGLYKDKELVAWVFIQENGALRHLYTLEEHRKNGFAELVLKLTCNIILKKNIYVLASFVSGKINSNNLYKKFGFQTAFDNGCALITSRN